MSLEERIWNLAGDMLLDSELEDEDWHLERERLAMEILEANTVAALYVDSDGPYIGQAGVDAWSVKRDARQYRGPYPVVAHPPCKRWGNYWHGSPSKPHEHLLGDDGGCFAAALWATRTYTGVIEHPSGSRAWAWFGLPVPPALGGGWSAADRFGGRSCEVTQSAYGHVARKLTWLYMVGWRFPQLDWSDRVDVVPVERMAKSQRHITPEPFRDLLLSMARDAGRQVEQAQLFG